MYSCLGTPSTISTRASPRTRSAFAFAGVSPCRSSARRSGCDRQRLHLRVPPPPCRRRSRSRSSRSRSARRAGSRRFKNRAGAALREVSRSCAAGCSSASAMSRGRYAKFPWCRGPSRMGLHPVSGAGLRFSTSWYEPDAAEPRPSPRVAARGGHRAPRRTRGRAGARAAGLERRRRRIREAEAGGQAPRAGEGVERRPGERVEAAADRPARLDAARRAAHLDGRRHAGAARHPTGDGVRRGHGRDALDAATAVGHDAGLRRLPRPQLRRPRRAGPRLRPRLPGRRARRRPDRQAPLAPRPGAALVAHGQRRRSLRRRPHRRGAAGLPRLPAVRRAHGATRGGDTGAHRAGAGDRGDGRLVSTPLGGSRASPSRSTTSTRAAWSPARRSRGRRGSRASCRRIRSCST